MIRHTGGSACGATSTRSRSSARAWLRASRVSTTPICAPSCPTRRTCAALILSLILGSAETPHHSFVENGAPDRCTSNTRAHPRPGSIGAVHDARPGTLDIGRGRPLDGQAVVLARVPEGDLEDATGTVWTTADPVRLLGRDLELVARNGLQHPVADLDREACIEHDPELVAEPMVVRPRIAAGHDRHEAGGRRLVERIGLRAPPGSVDDHVGTPSETRRS